MQARRLSLRAVYMISLVFILSVSLSCNVFVYLCLYYITVVEGTLKHEVVLLMGLFLTGNFPVYALLISY